MIDQRVDSAGQHDDLTSETHSADTFDWGREQELLDARLSHIPVPGGATTDGWHSISSSDGDAIRSLEWSRYSAGQIGVSVAGWQDEHGDLSQHIGICDVPDELTAGDARQFAAALVAAAEKLEALQ